MQLGEHAFEQHAQAAISVAGDPDDPTYASFAAVLDVSADNTTMAINLDINRDGTVFQSDGFVHCKVGASTFSQLTGHWIADPFWHSMNSSGTVYENGDFTGGPLFVNPYLATGYPITDPC